jgi:hypothetical protein
MQPEMQLAGGHWPLRHRATQSAQTSPGLFRAAAVHRLTGRKHFHLSSTERLSQRCPSHALSPDRVSHRRRFGTADALAFHLGSAPGVVPGLDRCDACYMGGVRVHVDPTCAGNRVQAKSTRRMGSWVVYALSSSAAVGFPRAWASASSTAVEQRQTLFGLFVALGRDRRYHPPRLRPARVELHPRGITKYVVYDADCGRRAVSAPRERLS